MNITQHFRFRLSINFQASIEMVSKLEAKLKSTLDDLDERVHQLETLDPRSEINVYCDELEIDVLSSVESAVKHLKTLQDNWLAEIKAYRDELMVLGSSRDSTSLQQQEVAPVKRDLELLKSVISQQIQERTDQEACIQWALEQTNLLNTELREAKQQIRKRVFNGKFLIFTPKPLFCIETDCIGELHREEFEMPVETSMCHINHLVFRLI